MIARSRDADARMLVSTWLNSTQFIVSEDPGHERTSGGALCRSKSYMEMTPLATAKEFEVLCIERLVKAFVDNHVAVGVAPEGVS